MSEVEELKKEIDGYLSIVARTSGFGEAIHVDGSKSGKDRSADREYAVSLTKQLIEAVREEGQSEQLKPVSVNMEECEMCGDINELGYDKCKSCGL